MFHLMREAGEAPAGATATAIRGDIYRLPFPDHVFDVVIASEILEHIPRDADAIAEVVRVLKPGGRLAVTVPRWWPERVCWALSDAYHEVEGGHVRIYRSAELVSRLRAADLLPTGTHHAHALHSPYWWLKCLFGVDNDAAIPKLYHKFLVYDLIHRPWWTRVPERMLNPVLGKSFVVYLDKPELAA
jgi:SAM-dependent methyltransferase